MRNRRRSGVLAFLAAAIGVGVFAVTANGIIPQGTGGKCSPNTGQPTPSNTSCVNFQFLPNTGVPASTFKNGGFEFRVNTTYANPSDTANGGFTAKIQVSVDSDFKITPGTLPTCSKSTIAGKTPKAALTACGPLNPSPSTKNAWLLPSTSTTFNGIAHTNLGFNGCVLAFNGPKTGAGLPTITLMARVYTTGGSPCTNPKTDTASGLTIPISAQIGSASAPYGKKIIAQNLPTSGDGLNDFDVLLKRGTYLSAKCSGHNGLQNGSKFWKVKTQWTYSGTPGSNGQPDDVANATQKCSN